jgi:Sulfotransferase family
VTTDKLDAGTLAREFRVPEPLMDAFVNRFAPARVALGKYHAVSEVMLFIHIPKTAGVSVGQTLQDSFDRFHGVEWNDIPNSFRNLSRYALYHSSRADERHVIMGHFGWPEMQMFRNHELPLKCGTFLRDPVARTISNYNYNCSTAHPAHENFVQRFPTLETYVDQIPIDVQITQALGFISSLENALEKLVRYYSFLGVTEKLSASLVHLEKSHGFSQMQEYRKNVGQAADRAEVSPTLVQKIRSRSHNDMRLHDLVMRLYQD